MPPSLSWVFRVHDAWHQACTWRKGKLLEGPRGTRPYQLPHQGAAPDNVIEKSSRPTLLFHRGVARGTSTLPCARGRGAPRGRSSACGVASRSASHCASEQEPVWGGRGAVEVGVGCSLSHRPASRAALPPGTRARCPLAPRGGEPPLGRRRRRAHAAGRPGGRAPPLHPTFRPAARTVLEPAALLPLRPRRECAHRRAAEGHAERRAMRRRRAVRARRAARQYLRTCTRTRVCQGRAGGGRGQRRRTSSACACFEGGAIPGAGD